MAPKIYGSLKNVSMVILGCGGIGSLLLYHLAAMGFEKFILVDGDVVSESNLNRQLFFTSKDCGSPKVEVLARGITAFRPTIELTIYKRMITEKSGISEIIPPGVSFVVCAIDTPPVACKLWTAKEALRKHCSCIFSGVGIDDGQVGPLLSNEDELKEYIRKLELEIENNPVFDRPINGSLSATNGIIASMLALEIFNYFVGLPFHSQVRRVQFDD